MQTDSNCRIESAKSLISEGRYGEAKGILEEVIAGDRDNTFAFFELAKICQIGGDDIEAEAAYRKVVAADRHFSAAYLELARIYYRQRRLDLALQHYRQVLAHAPDTAAAYREMGKLCDDLQSPEQALECMETAANLCPENTDILFELARASREAGKEERAAAVFRKLLTCPSVKNDAFLNNKVLNELEITERREVLESKVRAMIAMVTDRCNIKCKICDIWEGTWQARESIMQEIAGLFPYMEDISWQGGEVFMMKGFSDILEEGTRHTHLKQVIFTNGLLINGKILDKLSRGKVDLVFSIDAVDKETYERLRCGGRYDRLLQVLGMVREFRKSHGNNVSIYFNPVIMRSNHRQIERFVEFGREYGFNSITFAPIRGTWGDENIFDPPDAEALDCLKKSLPRAIAKAQEYGIRLNNWLPIDLGEGECPQGAGPVSGEHPAAGGSTPNGRMICYSPWQRLLIDCEGPVRPFGFCLKRYAGTVNTMSLAEIWNGEGMRSYRQQIAAHDYADLCQPECVSGQVRDKICRIE